MARSSLPLALAAALLLLAIGATADSSSDQPMLRYEREEDSTVDPSQHAEAQPLRKLQATETVGCNALIAGAASSSDRLIQPLVDGAWGTLDDMVASLASANIIDEQDIAMEFTQQACLPKICLPIIGCLKPQCAEIPIRIGGQISAMDIKVDGLSSPRITTSKITCKPTKSLLALDALAESLFEINISSVSASLKGTPTIQIGQAAVQKLDLGLGTFTVSGIRASAVTKINITGGLQGTQFKVAAAVQDFSDESFDFDEAQIDLASLPIQANDFLTPVLRDLVHNAVEKAVENIMSRLLDAAKPMLKYSGSLPLNFG